MRPTRRALGRPPLAAPRSVEPDGDRVAVTLSLADGNRARSLLAAEDVAWLDLRIGQIVSLTPGSAGDP